MSWRRGILGGRSTDRIDLVALGVVAGMTLLLVGLMARIVQLQVWPSEDLRRFMGSRTSELVEPGRRGDLLDRRGRLLAATRFGYRVFVDPEHFPGAASPRFEESVRRVAEAIGRPVEEVRARIESAMARNERLRAAQSAATPPPTPPPALGPGAGADPGQGLSAGDEGEEAAAGARAPGRLTRYVVLTPTVLDDARVDAVKQLRIPGVHLEHRAVRELADEHLAAALVGVVGWDGRGAVAAERVLDERMRGVDGSFSFVRDAAGRPLWVEPGGWTPPVAGEDVRLSIDLAIQAMLYEELHRGVVEADAQGGRGIVLDPASGEVLAIADIVREASGVVEYDWKTPIPRDKGRAGGSGPRYRTVAADPGRLVHPSLARNRCVEDVYEPGSTFKPFVWAVVTELGAARPEEVFDTGWGSWTTPYGRGISDVVKRPSQTWRDVLVNSSNIGMVQAASRLSFADLRDAVLRFGFGSRTGIGLPGETRGLVTEARRWTHFTQTSVAMGHEVAVTPVQMARAFAAFCRTGDRAGTIPPVTLLAPPVSRRGDEVIGQRVISPEVAALTRDTMRGVTARLDENLRRETGESGWRYELFGKSGTAEIPLGLPPPGQRRPRGSDGYFRGQYNSSFIAGGPAEQPRLVCLVVIDDPAPSLIARRRHYGAWVAGPVVRRVMDRALTYLGVPASRTPSGEGPAHGE